MLIKCCYVLVVVATAIFISYRQIGIAAVYIGIGSFLFIEFITGWYLPDRNMPNKK